ncbi:hypothetical protein EDD11_009065 [Mortierella claussenii]|nr:hypothetical protein EDD11_009065 [Mortierella claussenii]
MIVLKTALWLGLLATSSTYAVQAAAGPNSTLNANAPSASELGGVHLLLDNDVDSSTPKYPVIMLSSPRTYNDSQTACQKLGEKLVAPTFGNLTNLLNKTSIAQTELKGVTRVWVDSGNSTATNCTALDRNTGQTLPLNCTVRLPALCSNSMPHYVSMHGNTTQQIKVMTPKTGDSWQGYRDQNQFRFLGIPYAQPPVGNLRFMPPMSINSNATNSTNSTSSTGSIDSTDATNSTNSTTVRDATGFGNICTQLTYGTPQYNQTLDMLMFGAQQSEDCLYLNVFTPSLKANQTKGLPVMVYFHGGSYTSNAGSTVVFEPGNLVSRGGVVVVTLNYRLSIFGLFQDEPAVNQSTAPGNLAVRDQIAALQWVHDNVAAFGGNPKQVTIFGESAGAWSVRALLSAPSAFSLYQNAISQSDLMGLPFSNVSYASNLGNLTMFNLNCTSSDLACARNKTTAEVQLAQLKAMDQVLNTTQFDWVPSDAIYRPVVDGSFIPADFSELIKTGRYNKNASILWGTTRDEQGFNLDTLFPSQIPVQNATTEFTKLLRDNRTTALLQSPFYQFNTSDPDTVRSKFSEVATDFYFGCPAQIMSRGIAQQNGSVYTYQMNYGRNIMLAINGSAGFCAGRVCHADDIIPTFGSGDVISGVNQTGNDARFARQLIDRLSTFAKTGNPNPSSSAQGLAAQNPDVTGVQWTKYNASNPVFQFNLENSTMVEDADTARCNWIANNVPFEYQMHSPNGTFQPIFPPINNGTNSNQTTTLTGSMSATASATMTDTATSSMIYTTTSAVSETMTTTAVNTMTTPLVTVPFPTVTSS